MLFRSRRKPAGRARRPLSGRPAWTARLAPFALAASLVTVVGGAFLYQATKRSTRVMAAELDRGSRQVLRDEPALGTQQAPPPSRARCYRASTGACICRPIRRAPDSSWSAPDPVSTAKGKSRTSCIVIKGARCRCSCCRDTARAQGLVEVLGHEAAIWCVNDRTFVLVSREPKQRCRAARGVRADHGHGS